MLVDSYCEQHKIDKNIAKKIDVDVLIGNVLKKDQNIIKSPSF